MADSQPNAIALMGTSVSGQAVGAACAVVWLAYHHLPDTANGVSPAALEDALTCIFSTGVSMFFMISHLILAKLLTP